MDEFPKKFLNKLPTGFTDNVDSMSTEEIQDKILLSESHIYELDKAKDEDEKLKQAKELAKEIAAPYTEAKNAEMAKIKYCMFSLENRGLKIKSTLTSKDDE